MLYRSFIVISLCFICSCSRLDLAAKYADSYVAHRAGSFFDLNSEQKKTVKREVASEVSYTIKQEIPLLCQTLSKTHSLTNSYEIFEDFKGSQIQRLEPKVTEFISGLSDQQWAYFKNKLRIELKEKFSEISKYQKKQQKSTNKHLQEALGGLSKSQQQLVDKFFEQNPYPRQAQLESWQQILQLSTDDNKQWIKSYFKSPEKIMTSRYKNELSDFKKNLNSLLTRLDSSLNPDQQSRFKKFIQKKCQELS